MGRFIDTRRYMAGLRSQAMLNETQAMVAELEKDLVAILRKINAIPQEFTQRRRSIVLTKAGKVFVGTIRRNINDSWDDNYRYLTNGEKIKYHAGNLRKSIQVMRFRRSKNAVFVGAKITRKDLDEYGQTEKTTDPYYAHMVEYGTRHSEPQPFMRPGFERGKNEALRVLQVGMEKIVKQYERKIRRNERR